MLLLDTPITIGSKTYTHVAVSSIRLDFDARKLNVLLRFATLELDYLHIGTLTLTDADTMTLRPAPAVCSIDVVDSFYGDNAFQKIFSTADDLAEAIEQLVFDTNELRTKEYENGEDVNTLSVSWDAIPGQPSLSRTTTKLDRRTFDAAKHNESVAQMILDQRANVGNALTRGHKE